MNGTAGGDHMLIGNNIDRIASHAVNRSAAAGDQIFAGFVQHRHARHLRFAALYNLGDIRSHNGHRTRRLLRILCRLLL